jgi:signal transduction histidine kinase
MIHGQRLWLFPNRQIPMLKSWQFWVAQGCILLIEVVHVSLQGMGALTELGVAYFIPLSFFWVPVIAVSYVYGTKGAALTASWVVLVNTPDWITMQQGTLRSPEIFLVLTLAVTAFFVGRLVDQRTAAQRRAKVYAAYSVLNQEEVLRRLSLDIHDLSIQDLIAACHRLDANSQGSGELKMVRKLIQGVVQQLRNMSRGLRPSVLDDLGIVPAIRRELIELSARTGIRQKLEVRGEEYRLHSEVELQMFRIVQEALRNVERHAKAETVAVDIHFAARKVQLVITDDGAGFDQALLSRSPDTDGHFGIIGMMERAELAGGKLSISSSVGEGTRLSVTIPAPKETDLPPMDGATGHLEK